MDWLKHLRADCAGGLISAAVAIPLAMGYGMFAFASFGESYFADGALAGLTTAFVVAVVCVLLGDKTTTVYAPRVNSTFFLGLLIYGLVHSGMPEIAAGGVPLILAIAFSVVLLGGALEALFGLIKLGTLIKFAPQPVMAGFQNAAALLLFLVQLGNICGFDHNIPFTQVSAHLAEIKPLSVIAAITFTVMWNAKKISAKIPPMLIGILLGCALYYFCQAIGLGAYLGPVIANQERATMGLTAFPYFSDLKHSGDLLAFAPTIVSGALALAMIASIDALLCTKLVAASAEPRRNGDAILLRLGIANLVAACFGGITSGINIGASITNRTFGARSPLAVLINATAILTAGALLFRWLGEILRTALSAVIMVIAVQHFDLWNLKLLAKLRKEPRSLRASTVFDALVVIVVAVLSIALNIVAAVFIGIGIAIAVVLFVLHMSRSVVRRSYRCDDVRSRKSRTAPERQYLESAGSMIVVMELQGALFFGTGETTTKTIESALGQPTSCVIIDLRRLTEIDSTGAHALVELRSDLGRRKTKLLLAAGKGTRAAERLEEFGALSAFGDSDVFPDVDRAIEHAEDDLLQAWEQPGTTELRLAGAAFFAGFEPAQVTAVTTLMIRKVYEPGAVLFHEGDAGDEVLIATRGTASAYLQVSSGANIRLATFAPGTVFGELAILDQKPRAATVIADVELVCYSMSGADYRTLAETSPSAAIQFMAAIGRELSGRLRTANRTIHQLEA